MAVFSSGEADVTTIKVSQSEFQDGTFKAWAFKVVDAQGNVYTWKDASENLNHASTPTEAQISAYVKSYLTGGSHAHGGGSYAGVEKIVSTFKPRTFNNHKVLNGLFAGKTPPDNPNAKEKLVTNLKDTTTIKSYDYDTFTASDTTPSIKNKKMWFTHTGTLTITDFDDGVIGDVIYVLSKGAITFDVTSSGLKGGTNDLVTADGDLTCWLYNGTDWLLISFTDQSDNLS